MIYIIRQAGRDRFKIGYTKGRSDERMKELITGSSDPYQILHMFEGDMSDEEALHELFAPYHVQGEWFELNIARMFEIIVNYYLTGERIVTESERERSDSVEDFKRFLGENWRGGRATPVSERYSTREDVLLDKYKEWCRQQFIRPVSDDDFWHYISAAQIGTRRFGRDRFFNLLLREESPLNHHYVKYGRTYDKADQS